MLSLFWPAAFAIADMGPVNTILGLARINASLARTVNITTKLVFVTMDACINYDE